MATWNLVTPLKKDDLTKLRAGDVVSLSGVIYSCRDSAHKRMITSLDHGEALPFDIVGQVIYYMGPSPTPPGMIIGSCGPTTSSRMDSYTPRLYSMGMAASIGKGKRSKAVCEAMFEHTGVYFLATGGAGALISKCIKSVEIIAYEELGPEAIRKLEVEDMPLLVVNDSHGEELYTVPDLETALQ